MRTTGPANGSANDDEPTPQQSTTTATPASDTEEDQYLRMLSTETNVKRLNGENPYAITEVPLNVVFGKWLDSVEDGWVEFWSQQTNPLDRIPFVAATKEQVDTRPTVVVLGTGWASHSFVQLANAMAMKVIVVSPVNHFVSPASTSDTINYMASPL